MICRRLAQDHPFIMCPTPTKRTFPALMSHPPRQLRKSFKSEYVIKGAIPRAVHFKFKRSVDIDYLLIASVSSIALYSYMPPCNVQ